MLPHEAGTVEHLPVGSGDIHDAVPAKPLCALAGIKQLAEQEGEFTRVPELARLDGLGRSSMAQASGPEATLNTSAPATR